MVEYRLIKGKNAIVKFGDHPIGEVESLLLPHNGVIVEKGEAYGVEMSGSLRPSSIDGLYQQKLIHFSVKNNRNEFKPMLDKDELGDLVKGLKIIDVQMLKKQPVAQDEKVRLDIFVEEMANPNQTVQLQNGVYSLKDFKFKCEFKEKPWKT
jgi:hypothetical protein